MGILTSTYPADNLGSNRSDDKEETEGQRQVYVATENDSIWGVKIREVTSNEEEDPCLT